MDATSDTFEHATDLAGRLSACETALQLAELLPEASEVFARASMVFQLALLGDVIDAAFDTETLRTVVIPWVGQVLAGTSLRVRVFAHDRLAERERKITRQECRQSLWG